jgi:predicted DNA-binding transcriptional regulator AlpA
MPRQLGANGLIKLQRSAGVRRVRFEKLDANRNLGQSYPKINTGEAAAHVGIASSTLVKLRMIGEGPSYIKIGRRVVYDLSDVDEWLSRLRQIAASEGGCHD